MRPTILIVMVIGLFSCGNQDKAENAEEDRNYQEVVYDAQERPDKFALYPDGISGLQAHIRKNVYSSDSSKAGVESGKVIVRFIVNETGEVEQIRIVQSVSKSLDAEAIRLVRSLERWRPAIRNGRPVKIEYQLPILF